MSEQGVPEPDPTGVALDAGWVRAQLVERLGEEEERVAAWDAIVREHGA